MSKKVSISKLKPNAGNPRSITDEALDKLVQSIKEFPEMLQVRPLIVNKDMVVLGGNMRLTALKKAGIKTVPIEVVDWSPEKEREFIIKDNLSFGQWDFDVIQSEWTEEAGKFDDWGFESASYFLLGSAEPGNSPSFDDEPEMESLNRGSETPPAPPSPMDDRHSTFELIMVHNDKLKLIEILNQVKEEQNLIKHSEALMYIINQYEGNK